MKINCSRTENTSTFRSMKTRDGRRDEKAFVMRRQEKIRQKKGNETAEWDGGSERTFLHYRHVRGLITGTRGVIFSPSSSHRFAAFFFGSGATSRRLTLLGMRQAVHCHDGKR